MSIRVCRNSDPNVTSTLDWKAEAIIHYGRHHNDCTAFDYVHDFKCSCGFREKYNRAAALLGIPMEEQ